MSEGYGTVECDDNLISLISDLSNNDKIATATSSESTHSSSDDGNKTSNNNASTLQTSINMVKMCVGTGTLALPYAAKEGGLIWYIVGLSILTLWNIYSTDRLLKCCKYMNEYKAGGVFKATNNNLISKSSGQVRRNSYQMRSHEERIDFEEDDEYRLSQIMKESNKSECDENTNLFGKVAFFAFGNFGLQFVDAMMMVLMLGIVIAYEDAILGFVASTPLTTGSNNLDAICLLLIIGPLASLSDFSLIAKVSAIGTFIIFFIFISVGFYGIHENGIVDGLASIPEQNLWPDGFSGFSSWYGVVAFGFGTIPFTFTLQESMQKPTEMMEATTKSLWVVFLTYGVIGIFLSIIFWPSLHGFQSDMTDAIPNHSLLSNTLKLSMSVVILSTVPLIIVPFGDLVMQKLGLDKKRHESPNDTNYTGSIVRISLCIICAFISLSVPNFVYVLSFIGCFCVALISYAYPALAHIVCFFKLYNQPTRISVITKSEWRQLYLDMVLIPISFASCLLTSTLTFRQMMKEIENSSSN